MKKIPNIHPGEILLEEFLIPLEITQAKLAKTINVTAKTISEIVSGKKGVTIDISLKLGKYFRMAELFFFALQLSYDVKESKKKLAKELAKITPHKIKKGVLSK